MTTYDDTSGVGALLAVLLIFIPILLIFALAFYLISSFFLMRIFDKAGVEGRWRAWVPVYNTLVLSKLGDVSPWITLGVIVAAGLLGNIPFVGWVFWVLEIVTIVMIGWRVGLKVDKDWYYLLLWILAGVGTLIWYGIVGLSRDPWNPAIRPAPWANSFLADKTVWRGIPSQGGGAAPAAPAF